jgi:hypothetical protein
LPPPHHAILDDPQIQEAIKTFRPANSARRFRYSAILAGLYAINNRGRL